MAAVSKLYADQKKLSLSDWYTTPSGIQNIKGEIFPSYYNKSTGTSTAKMTFDKVSKKKATSCTPEDAKIEIGVIKARDDFTKKEIITSTDGSYDTNADDDAHQCDDAKPTVSVSTTSSGTVSVTYTHGRYTLQSIELLSGSTVVASKQIDSNGTWTLSPTDLASAANGTITAKVTDVGYYTATNSTSYQKSSSSSSGS